MADAVEVSSGRRVRRWRSVSEKLQIVQLTLKPGASVAQVARAHGVNANQVFKWRRAFERGELSESVRGPDPGHGGQSERDGQRCGKVPQVGGGAIHIELPGRAMISVESGADSSLVRSILESLRK